MAKSIDNEMEIVDPCEGLGQEYGKCSGNWDPYLEALLP